MTISPDEIVLFSWGGFSLNATIVYTWLLMALLGGGAWLATRHLRDDVPIGGWQNFLEVLVQGISDQLEALSQQKPGVYLPFVGTLFVFIAASNILAVVPGYRPPTGSLSTTTALAICVFVAVPVFSISQSGFRTWLRHYIRPTPFMLPFNVIGDISRTLALAVRLYGNIMSGTVVVGLLLSLTPFFFPVVMQLFGLLTGMIQAYIFAVLAMVYIASASSHRPTSAHDDT